MELSISHQLLEAGLSLGIGIVSGFLYDILKSVRKRVNQKLTTDLLDLLFWLVFGSMVFLLGMSVGEGHQRIFVIVLAFLGGSLYFCTVSPYVTAVCGWIVDGIGYLFYLLFLPVALLWHGLIKITFFLKKFFQYRRKWYKIKNQRKNVVIKQRERAPAAIGGGEADEVQKGKLDYQVDYYRADGLSAGHAGEPVQPH